MGGVEREELAEAIWGGQSRREFHTRGKVTSANADGTLTVRLGGSSVGTRCSRLASCQASAGDVVLVLVDAMGNAVALGKIARS